MSGPFLLLLPLLWSGVGALRRDPRATETEPRKRGGGTREPEGERGIESERLVGGKTAGERSGREWREPERTGRKEREGRGRKLEEAERKLRKSETEPATGKTKTEAEELSRGDTRGRGRRTNLEAV